MIKRKEAFLQEDNKIRDKYRPYRKSLNKCKEGLKTTLKRSRMAKERNADEII